ncbi:DUF4199 domain-containing protein [Spirosoma sp. KUDC1026]|uniref:DUF4199 domain-containing protein n=1 Tax=Spirosoma sp. KUDC1026 TaxID=2745947 RepID=UPI001E4FFCFC|nr:DUF4199 domain-containing protein [Spirosoma sp. KUDC1026]
MNEDTSPARIALKWGLLTALVELLVTSIRYAMHEYVNFTFQGMTFVILVAGTILAMRELRLANGGWLSIREGLSMGLLMFAVIGILDTTYQQIYQSYVDTSYTQTVLEQTRNMMERSGAKDEQLDMFDEQVEKMDDQPAKGMAGIAFIGGVLTWILGGLFLSLIIAAFMRRVKSNPFD